MEIQELEQEWVSKFNITNETLKENLSPACYDWAKANPQRTEELRVQMIKEGMNKCYEDIILFLKDWVDIPEEHMKVISLWVIGTYFHKEFSAYPYLFFNAMRGSGKSRLLNIISWLQKGGTGELLNNPSESVIFRTAKDKGLIFDEFESQKSKDKQTMREYLNACYKVGGIVYRMEKQKDANGKEKQVAVGHKLYTPIAMANINGIEDVLADRSISLIIEKSMNPYFVKKIEDFDVNEEIIRIKANLSLFSVELSSVESLKNTRELWNKYIKHKYTSLHTIHTTHYYTPLYTQDTTSINAEEMFLKIDNTGIFGRNLELFFPLLLIAKLVNESIFDEMLHIVGNMNKAKKEDEFAESKDISLLEFVSTKQEYQLKFVMVSELFNEFKMFTGATGDVEEGINLTWFGLALKRLKLIGLMKRINKGKMILLNVAHAKEKLKIFKEVEHEN